MSNREYIIFQILGPQTWVDVVTWSTLVNYNSRILKIVISFVWPPLNRPAWYLFVRMCSVVTVDVGTYYEFMPPLLLMSGKDNTKTGCLLDLSTVRRIVFIFSFLSSPWRVWRAWGCKMRGLSTTKLPSNEQCQIWESRQQMGGVQFRYGRCSWVGLPTSAVLMGFIILDQMYKNV